MMNYIDRFSFNKDNITLLVGPTVKIVDTMLARKVKISTLDSQCSKYETSA